MLGENYVYFFTVQGFFVGIIFGVLKSFDANGLFIYTFLITTFFYLFSHIIIALYYRTLTARSYNFSRDITGTLTFSRNGNEDKIHGRETVNTNLNIKASFRF